MTNTETLTRYNFSFDVEVAPRKQARFMAALESIRTEVASLDMSVELRGFRQIGFRGRSMSAEMVFTNFTEDVHAEAIAWLRRAMA